MDSLRLFTDTSEHIRFLLFSFFRVPLLSLLFSRFLFLHFFLSICVYYVFFVMGGQLRWTNASTGSLPL